MTSNQSGNKWVDSILFQRPSKQFGIISNLIEKFFNSLLSNIHVSLIFYNCFSYFMLLLMRSYKENLFFLLPPLSTEQLSLSCEFCLNPLVNTHNKSIRSNCLPSNIKLPLLLLDKL